MARGSLRVSARVERELFVKLGYGEDSSRGVLVLEEGDTPTDEVAAWVAAKAKMAPAALTFAVAPTAASPAACRSPRGYSRPGCHRWRPSVST